ncbi:MAG: excalibur calcium-binding domain-containing protein [Novosphingobium sp.]
MEQGARPIRQALRPAAIALGLARRRPPQAGDYWRGCRDARSAGTAPIYYGEPGYRSGMDSDDDGIACEPYRGM